MDYKIYNLIIAVALVLGISCASQTKASNNSNKGKPEWVMNPKADYPAIRYLSYVGSGPTKRTAEREAKTGMSSIFKENIKSETNLNQSVQESGSYFNKTMKMTTNTSTSTDVELKNVKVSGNYYDQSEDTYYVLVTVDKMTTADIFEEDIKSLLASNSKMFERFTHDDNQVNKLRIIGEMYANALKIEELKSKLSVLGQPHRSMGDELDKATIEDYRAKVLDKVFFHVTISGGDEKILNFVKKEFTEMDFKLAPSQAAAALDVSIDLRQEDTKLPGNNAKFKSWYLTVKLENNLTHNQIFVYNAKGRSSQLNKSALKQRVNFDIEKKIKKELKTYIVKYLFKQS